MTERSGAPKEKPVRPNLRGEIWKLQDGREVTILRLLAVNGEGGRCLEVINESGRLEAIYEPQFVQRVLPPHLAGMERFDDESPSTHD